MSRTRTRRPWSVVGVTVVAGMANAMVGQASAPPSGATTTVSDAVVVASSLLFVPGGDLIWTVTDGNVPAGGGAPIAPDDVAAILAVTSGRALTATDTSMVSLGTGEAVAIPADTEVGVLGDVTVGLDYVVVTARSDADASTVIGAPFELAAGGYDLDLLADVVQPGETVTIPDAPSAPLAVMVLGGELGLEGGAVPLAAASRTVIEGDVVLTNDGAEPSVVLIARIGDRIVAEAPAPTPTSDDDRDDTVVDDEPDTTDGEPTIDPDLDSDGDKVPDVDELAMGSDPNDPDTDDDGLDDWDEIRYAGDPNDPDTDGDNITDGDEVNLYDTQPSMSDSDSDGFDDYAEIETGFDPTDPASHP